METFNHIVNGFGVALMPINLWYTFVGVLIGTIVGILPGIGPSASSTVASTMTLSDFITTNLSHLACRPSAEVDNSFGQADFNQHGLHGHIVFF